MTPVDTKLKDLIKENSLLKKELDRYLWKEVNESPPPSGKTLLLYMNTGILIQGNGNTPGITHWMNKPLSPGKQNGGLK